MTWTFSTLCFMYFWVILQCRLRGRLDTNGCIAAYLEERLNLGVNFLLSAEVSVPASFGRPLDDLSRQQSGFEDVYRYPKEQFVCCTGSCVGLVMSGSVYLHMTCIDSITDETCTRNPFCFLMEEEY